MKKLFSLVFTRRSVLMLGLTLAVLAGCLSIAQYAADMLIADRLKHLLKEEQSVSARLSRSTRHIVNQDLLLIKGIPRMLGEIPQIQDALASFGKHAPSGLSATPPAKTPSLAAVNELLRATQTYFGVERVWLDTIDGQRVASSEVYGNKPPPQPARQ